MGDWFGPESSFSSLEAISTTPKPRLSESFYASGNISLYWEQRVSDYINLVYIPICCSIGIVGNSVAFCVLVLSNLRHTTTCLYMAVIACLDTLVLVLNICFFVRRFPDYEIFNEWSCGVIMFLFYFAIHFDVMLLVAMTFERYVAVTYPLHASGMITTKKTVTIITVLGMLSFALNLFNVFTRGMVEVQPGVKVCSVKGEISVFFVEKVYTWIDSAIYCFIPVISLFTMNVKIIKVLEKAAIFQDQMAPSLVNSSSSIATIQDTVSQNDHVSNEALSTAASDSNAQKHCASSTKFTNNVTRSTNNGNLLDRSNVQEHCPPLTTNAPNVTRTSSIGIASDDRSTTSSDQNAQEHCAPSTRNTKNVTKSSFITHKSAVTNQNVLEDCALSTKDATGSTSNGKSSSAASDQNVLKHCVPSTTNTKNVTKTSSNGHKIETKSQHQVTLMLILVSFAFLILATPVAIFRLIEKYAWIPQDLQDRARQNLVHAVTDNLMYTNHAVNFVLYMLSGRKFRSEFNRIICRCRTRVRKK